MDCDGGRDSPPRFTDDRRTLSDFQSLILVQCPRCRGCARVSPDIAEAATNSSRRRLVCGACGLAKQEAPLTTVGEAPCDPYFCLPLWLQTPCCGEILWAYNADHLAYLESFIGAKLRERVRDPELGWSNRSMVSRLPDWMLSAKHRDAVLRGIAHLKERTAP